MGLRLLRKTFGVDAWVCAACGGKRRVLASLTSPAAVRALLQHLQVPTTAPPLALRAGPAAMGVGGLTHR